MIMIAHTLSVVKNADQILVLAQGRIAEAGTYAELLKDGGIYAAMWEARRELRAGNSIRVIGRTQPYRRPEAAVSQGGHSHIAGRKQPRCRPDTAASQAGHSHIAGRTQPHHRPEAVVLQAGNGGIAGRTQPRFLDKSPPSNL